MRINKIISKTYSLHTIIVFLSLFSLLTLNTAFWGQVLSAYSLSIDNVLPLLSILVVFFCALNIFWTAITSKYTLRNIVIGIVLISSFAAYFMNSYGVAIDSKMLENIVATDTREMRDLFSLKMIIFVLVTGIIPSLLLLKLKLKEIPIKRAVIQRVGFIIVNLIIMALTLFIFSKFYASFFREHKPIRYYSNPTYWVYSSYKYLSDSSLQPLPFVEIGNDANVVEDHEEDEMRELIIMVVGETARSDRFSLNGYSKKTNSYLEKENVISFKNVTSCGTSTAVSVPCLFSLENRENFAREQADSHSNLIDILIKTKEINVIWRDNNSDSKGVAVRGAYEDFRTSELNSICDEECRDEGMLVNLPEYIDKRKGEDILIVLHQMGSHGPAYYKRYPEHFEIFSPTCKSNELKECSEVEINNTYDNTIAYTDYFLGKVIALLKKYETTHEVGMIYVSDHGESLGENGIYLHSMPYSFAPKAQTHVPVILWLGDYIRDELDYEKLKNEANKEYSHDNIFHTLLGMFEVHTDLYNSNLDILFPYKKHYE